MPVELSAGAPTFYGVKIEWERAPLSLRAGEEAVFILVLVAAVYPLIHVRRLETVEVLRTS